MEPRSRPDEQIRMLQLGYAAAWLIVGLVPPALAVRDEAGGTRYGTWSVLAVLLLGYAILERRFPARRYAFLLLLTVGMGMVAYLMEGAASLYIVSIPHFWIAAGSPRRAIIGSGIAAVVSIIAGTIPQGWSPDFGTGNVVAVLSGFAAGSLIGLWMDRVLGRSDERARRLSAELERARARLAEAHQRQGAAEERDRLAREIHDTLAQGFASIIVLAEAARSGIDTDPGRSAQQLRSIENTARENFTEARILVGSAPRGGPVAGSVAATLRRTLDRFAEDTGLAVDADLAEVECDQQTRIALLRCTQESLANVRKHAAASTVSVALVGHPYGLELEITDDGEGFVVAESTGFGLDGMRKRLAELGGELTVTSSIGNGTRILAMIPHG